VKGTGYQLDAPVVNPDIVPKLASIPLKARAGDHFIGVENPDERISRALGPRRRGRGLCAGTVFEVTVWANRGRLETASIAAFGKTPSEVTLQFFGGVRGVYP
jgi:hypothetical protein